MSERSYWNLRRLTDKNPCMRRIWHQAMGKKLDGLFPAVSCRGVAVHSQLCNSIDGCMRKDLEVIAIKHGDVV
jgi:hypothetical protein